jgi:hypothetical protein
VGTYLLQQKQQSWWRAAGAQQNRHSAVRLVRIPALLGATLDEIFPALRRDVHMDLVKRNDLIVIGQIF